ncbi:MAG: efflux RND transporter periplasmic adaptor subunit [Akkermansiaceae bacterium]|nr:efflux RND transporter periplasmic adaptor subunit [Verrucomicrobiales bacterium]
MYFRALPLFVRLICVAAVCGTLTSCSRSGDATKPAVDRPAVPVTVARAVQRDVPVQIQAVGNVEPFSMVAVRPQITGKIQEIHFEEGRDVKAGDLLVTLETSSWAAALNQANANLKRDEAQWLNARLEFQRASNLFASKIASQQDYQSAEANLLAAESTVQAAAAAVTNAMVNLSYAEIRSPIDGRTGLLGVKAGNVVKAPDDVLVTITQIRPAYVAFAVPEQHLSSIRRRSGEAELPVLAFAPGETSQAAQGKLTFIDNRVNTDTGTVLLRATFENSNLVLWPGQFVQTILTLSNVFNAIVVPTPVVQNGQNGEFVFVVKADETVEARPVKSGVAYRGTTTILSGLAAGETVVADGHLRLTPNARVTIKASSDDASPTNTAPSR